MPLRLKKFGKWKNKMDDSGVEEKVLDTLKQRMV